ncbi:MAG: G-D-S-L family lipolytic protein [Cyclobacteriaceae bacterium]|nr:G-D-S-L family lipolytic protein [Cyclobacteriaceae bacterium]
MKLISCALIVMTLLTGMNTKKKVIFFGDSITEAGVKPGGYIVKVGELAAKENKADQYEFVGAGIGGNKVYDLYLRLEDDVLNKNPDVVVIYIGVNDVWHKQSHGTGTDYDKFEKFYSALIKKIQAKGAKVILATPAVVGERTDFSNELDGDLNRYSSLIRTLAEKNKLPLVDLRKAFLEYNKVNNPENKESGILTTDRVHLNDKGNDLVANEMWKAIKGL